MVIIYVVFIMILDIYVLLSEKRFSVSFIFRLQLLRICSGVLGYFVLSNTLISHLNQLLTQGFVNERLLENIIDYFKQDSQILFTIIMISFGILVIYRIIFKKDESVLILLITGINMLNLIYCLKFSMIPKIVIGYPLILGSCLSGLLYLPSFIGSYKSNKRK